jgi:hypothetical protein
MSDEGRRLTPTSAGSDPRVSGVPPLAPAPAGGLRIRSPQGCRRPPRDPQVEPPPPRRVASLVAEAYGYPVPVQTQPPSLNGLLPRRRAAGVPSIYREAARSRGGCAAISLLSWAVV